jgi:hypothetical protein
LRDFRKSTSCFEINWWARCSKLVQSQAASIPREGLVFLAHRARCKKH